MPKDEPLTDSHKIVQAVTIANGAAGSSPINGAVIDMTDFEHVTFVVQIGPVVGGAVTSIKAQRGNAANLSDAADIEGTSITIADTDDDKVKVLTVLRPAERYVRLVVGRGTQNATVAAIAILYGAHLKPVTQPSDVAGEVHKDKPEGTA